MAYAAFFHCYLGAILDESSPTIWDGYHGTTGQSASAIMSDNYLISAGAKEWLGHGAYFFIDGFPNVNPQVKASAWAKKRTKEFIREHRKHSEIFAVIHSSVQTRMHLDLDDADDREMFTEIRQRWVARLRKERVMCSRVALENDCLLANFAMDELDLDALVSMECILTFENGFEPTSRHPNCRIMCVRNPSECIISSKMVSSGRVYG